MGKDILTGQIKLDWLTLNAKRNMLPEKLRPRTAEDTSRQKYSAAMLEPLQETKQDESILPEVSLQQQTDLIGYFESFFSLLKKVIDFSEENPDSLSTLPIQAYDITYHIAQYHLLNHLLKSLFPKEECKRWDDLIKNYKRDTTSALKKETRAKRKKVGFADTPPQQPQKASENDYAG